MRDGIVRADFGEFGDFRWGFGYFDGFSVDFRPFSGFRGDTRPFGGWIIFIGKDHIGGHLEQGPQGVWIWSFFLAS